MANLTLYDKLRVVPENAKKTIFGGRLKGMTDINPMWRIKALTEAFGACGFGWWYEITDKHIERTDGGEIAAFVDINLYYVLDGVTSKPVQGTGGSAFIAREKSGLYVSDECYKMALTDAISVACKALGMGADVYWDSGRTKYDQQTESAQSSTRTIVPDQKNDPPIVESVKPAASPKSMIESFCAGNKITREEYDTIVNRLIAENAITGDRPTSVSMLQARLDAVKAELIRLNA